MRLGTEVNLGPGDVVLDGVAAHLSPKRVTAPQLLAHVYCSHGCPSHLSAELVLKKIISSHMKKINSKVYTSL